MQGCGIHPSADPWGRPFDMSYYPALASAAGKPICGPYKFILDGMQGDADYVAHTFSLTRRLIRHRNLVVSSLPTSYEPFVI